MEYDETYNSVKCDSAYTLIYRVLSSCSVLWVSIVTSQAIRHLIFLMPEPPVSKTAREFSKDSREEP